MDEVPGNVKSAAILQIVSGSLNLFVVTWVAYFGLATICSISTFFLGGIGGLCGFAACGLIPVGLIEIISGVVALSNPRGSGTILRLTSYLEMASFFFGGVLSAIAGGVVMSLLSDADVKYYLDG